MTLITLISVAPKDRVGAGIIFFCVLGTIVVALALRIYRVLKMLHSKGNVIHWDLSGVDIEEAALRQQDSSQVVHYETSGSYTTKESE